jgi:hypothetical protein
MKIRILQNNFNVNDKGFFYCKRNEFSQNGKENAKKEQKNVKNVFVSTQQIKIVVFKGAKVEQEDH